MPSPAPTSGNFLLRKGVYAPLEDFSGGAATAYTSTNNRGEFAGTYTDAGGTLRGFHRDRKGRFTTIDPPGALATFTNGINDRGQVVGYYGVAGGKVQSFLRDRSGDITTVDVPGAAGTQPFDINNRGQVVGLFVDAAPDADGTIPPNTIHGFVWSKGSFRTIDVPGATGSGALDINDRGEIVGGYQDAQGRTHGFRLRKGVFTTIDPPGAVDVPGSPGFAATAPFGINNRGQVVGQYADARGTARLSARRRGLQDHRSAGRARHHRRRHQRSRPDRYPHSRGRLHPVRVSLWRVTPAELARSWCLTDPLRSRLRNRNSCACRDERA